MAEGGACTFIAKHNDTYLVDLTYGQQENLSDALINGGVAKASKSSSQASDRSHGNKCFVVLSQQIVLSSMKFSWDYQYSLWI